MRALVVMVPVLTLVYLGAGIGLVRWMNSLAPVGSVIAEGPNRGRTVAEPDFLSFFGMTAAVCLWPVAVVALLAVAFVYAIGKVASGSR